MNDEVTTTAPEPFRDVLRIDEGQLKDHLDQVVRDSVEQTLNALLDAEADALCGAQRYQRSPERRDTRAGHYTRRLHTKAGEVALQVPRLRKLPFETQIIARYQRRESCVEEALIEMYLAGVSVRRVEDITEALRGHARQPEHGQRAEPEDLRPHRGLAEPAARRRAPLRVPRRPLAEAELGRRGQERGRAGGRRRQRRRLPGAAGRDGRRQGGRGGLADLPAAPQGARPFGRAPGDLRQVPGPAGGAGGLLPRGRLAAVRRAFLSDRLHAGAVGEGQGGGGAAEGDPRPGGPGGGAAE